MRRGKRIAPILLLDSISHSSLVTNEGRPQNCALLNHYTHWINYYEKTNVVLQYFIYLWEKTQKATFQESDVYRQSYGDSFGDTLPNYSLDLIFFFAQIVMQIA